MRLIFWVIPPVANFSGTPTIGAAAAGGELHRLLDQHADAWSWSFGDSNSSTVQNPSHTYSSAGSYTVALTATNAGGNNTCTKPTTSPSAIRRWRTSPARRQRREAAEGHLHRQLDEQPDRVDLELR